MNMCCNGCKYGILCPTWGEYKCIKKKCWVSGDACDEFKAITKDNKMQKCQCNDCLERKDVNVDN